MSGETLYELRNVRLGYGGAAVLDVREFRFERSCVYALLGPNGSGKTTLLRALAGLHRPAQGRIMLDGEKMYRTGRGPAAVKTRRRVTLVSQSPVLFDASLSYNVAYGLRIRGVGAAEAAERARAAIDSVGLAGLEHRNALGLSGGESQRAAIARAIVLRTDIVLLDEPTGNVDVENTSIIESIVRDVSERSGVTIIFSTHSSRQARRLAVRAVHFLNGRLKPESPDRPAGYLWDI